MMTQWLNEAIAWWSALSAAAAFFFAIPFVVAAAGLLALALRKPSR